MGLFTDEYKVKLETVIKCQSDVIKSMQTVIYNMDERLRSIEKEDYAEIKAYS